MVPMRMLKRTRRAAWLMGHTVMLAALGTVKVSGADTNNLSGDPLLDLFIKKGYVTQEEAEKVKAEADFSRTNGMAVSPSDISKWKISKGTKSVELFGDIRLRYEYRSAQDPRGGYIDLQRARYALRLGLRGEVLDDFYYGLRLDTSPNPRSTWVTAGTAASTSSSSPIYQGPFGKSNGGLNVGEIYVGWHPAPWLDLTVGQMPNPLYTTPMVWSSSLNPQGAAEHFKYSVGEADFFATFGQFLYQDTNPNQASPSGYFGQNALNNRGGSSSIFLLAWQAGFIYHLPKETSLKVAPVLYYYSGNGNDITPGSPGFSDTYVGQGANAIGIGGYSGYPAGYFGGFNANQTGVNDLLVIEFPFEFDFNVSKLKARVFGDYAYNFDGSTRAQDAYNVALVESKPPYTNPDGSIPPYYTTAIPSPQTHDVQAYQIGFSIGSSNVVYGPMQGLVYGTSSAKNAWEFRTYWQHIEQYSLDPNLIDTDFFEGSENLQGIYAAVAYGFSDNIIGTVRYGYASRINNKLGTGGSGQDIPQMNPINTFNLFQVDLTVRF